MNLEFSIHELIRQITTEKECVIKKLSGGKLLDYAEMLPEDEKLALVEIYNIIDSREQSCGRQSQINAEVSFALLEQSKKMLDYFQKQLIKEDTVAYTQKGSYSAQSKSLPRLLSVQG